MSPHASHPPSNVLYRNLFEVPYHAKSANGIYITLSNGQRVIDGSGGAAVTCLGHNNPEILAAVTKQMSEISYTYSGSGFTNDGAEELATLILGNEPGGLSKAIFLSSGSEAIEAALKLARQFHIENGEPQRTRVISRSQSYHGNTLGALAVSGHKLRRSFYEPIIADFATFVSPCFAYRGKNEGEPDEAYVERLKEELEDEVLRLGPDTVAAFLAETVSGATLGCVPAVKGYFKAVRAICDKYGILLILDEVMCGMGKTGTLHAWEQEDISGPDIQTVAKCLGGGFAPISGVLMNHRIVNTLAAGSGILQHGHTYQAHPVACAAAAAVQRIIKRDNLLYNVQIQGSLLGTLLKAHLSPLSIVGDVRGRGLFWGIEFVKNKDTKESFALEKRVAARVVKHAMQRGLNLLPSNGISGGHFVDHVLVAPAYTVKEEEIRIIVSLLRDAVVGVIEELEGDV
ncbi:hypothetical protein RUND412_004831 [Rhizina undulata]